MNDMDITDPSHPLNPINPLSPLNPVNPLSIYHETQSVTPVHQETHIPHEQAIVASLMVAFLALFLIVLPALDMLHVRKRRALRKKGWRHD